MNAHDIVRCVECKVVLPRSAAYPHADGYFSCSRDHYNDHELRIKRRRDDTMLRTMLQHENV